MPLLVKDFSWEETEKMVFVTVPLKGVKANKVDILSSEEYLKGIKEQLNTNVSECTYNDPNEEKVCPMHTGPTLDPQVSYPPYLFECFLYAPVDDRNSTAQVGNGAVVFKMLKKEIGLWETLQSEIAGDKVEMKRKREEALQKVEERLKEESTKKDENKRANEKFALKEIMKTEENERSRIENEKETERRKATEDLERWKEEQRQKAEEEKQKFLEERRKEEAAKKEELQKQKEEERKNRRRGKKNDIFEDSAGGVPKREVGKISVSFTPRVFPTPERESVKPQEEEWLKKQAESRRVIELEDENLSEEEKNPIWLRDKGNEFFKAGNYEAAVNAYSHAIRLNHKIHSCFSNRAACHLKMRNFFKCIEDCSKALELLTPPVPQNAASRCKCMVRRGTALCQLEMYVEGLKDYENALKLDPGNEELRADAEKIRHTIQTETVS